MSASPAPASTARIFVGRDEELTTLATGLDDALGGHGSLVTIVGEPGIGKTRTVEERPFSSDRRRRRRRPRAW